MVQAWQEGDSALQVALDHAASSFGSERIPVDEAAGVLRSLAGARTDLLTVVANAKLEDRYSRGYEEQVSEMFAAAALLRAAATPATAPAPPSVA